MPNLTSVTLLAVQNSARIASDTRASNKRIMSGIDDTTANLAEGITARTQRGSVNAVQASLENLITLTETRRAGLQELSRIIGDLTQVLQEARDLDAVANAAAGARTKQIGALVASYDAVRAGTKYGSIAALSSAASLNFVVATSHLAAADPAVIAVAGPGLAAALSTTIDTAALDFTAPADVETALAACDAALTTLNTALDAQTSTINLATQLKAQADTKGANLDALAEGCLATDVSKESAIAREAQFQLNLVAAMMGIVDDQNDTRISILRS